MVMCSYLLTIATSIEARKPLSGGPRPAAAFASAASYIFSFFSLFSRRLCLAVPVCSASAFSFTKYMLPRRGETCKPQERTVWVYGLRACTRGRVLQDTPAGNAVVLTESRQVRVQLCLLSDHFLVVFHLELSGADVVPTVLVDSTLETMQSVVLILATLAASMGFPAWRSSAHAQ